MADLQEINMTKATDMNNKKVRLVGDDGKGYWMEKEDLAQVVGELITNTNYLYISNLSGTATLHKLNIKSWSRQLAFEIIGTSNTNEADIFIITGSHTSNVYCYNKSQQGNMKLYGDMAGSTQFYVYLPAYSKAILRFINRVPADNTITSEDVTSTVSTSDLVEL